MLTAVGGCDVCVVIDVFQRYDSTGTGRILQNDLYKFMKQMHADNRQYNTTHPYTSQHIHSLTD